MKQNRTKDEEEEEEGCRAVMGKKKKEKRNLRRLAHLDQNAAFGDFANFSLGGGGSGSPRGGLLLDGFLGFGRRLLGRRLLGGLLRRGHGEVMTEWAKTFCQKRPVLRKFFIQIIVFFGLGRKTRK